MKEILREIGAITRCFESIANIEFKDYKLSKNQYIYLVRVCEAPGIILERVCDMIKVDRSTGSRAVEKLAAAGFLYKRKEPGNRKNNGLYPTEKGLRVYEMLKNDETYSNGVALAGFSEEELAAFHSYLVRVRKNIEPDWDAVKKGGSRKYPRVELE